MSSHRTTAYQHNHHSSRKRRSSRRKRNQPISHPKSLIQQLESKVIKFTWVLAYLIFIVGVLHIFFREYFRSGL